MKAPSAANPAADEKPGPWRALPSAGLRGRVRVPGDKSISHRALMLGGMALGESEIHGLLEGEDVLRTAAAMRLLGAEIRRDDRGVWHAEGRGIGGLAEAPDILDLGNAGTGTRLLMGLVAPYPMMTIFTGDASLRRRPMQRVIEPLRRMGAEILARSGGRPPLAVIGTASPLPIDYVLPVASAQVKSAILLAALNTPGITSVIEPEPTRDHTELMLAGFGVAIESAAREEGGRILRLQGQPELRGRRIEVPGDPSSAAFPLVAAAILPGSEITIEKIGLNPHRIGLIQTLREMGADIAILGERQETGEIVGDLRIRHNSLQGVKVPAARAPAMIDEYPILAIAAAFAEGETLMTNLAELRVKESDRLATIARGLAACGIDCEEGPDWLKVRGKGGKFRPRGGARVAVNLDHRIAMAFLILGLNTEKPVEIDDLAPVATSFPGFVELMRGLGAALEPLS